jgi:hypothetical protein
MMANVDEEMAKIAIRSRTPLVWKREGNKLAYAYCLTCKKVSLGDAINFKKRHSEKLCKSGWTTYQDLFLAKAPLEEAEVEPVNEIVGSSEIPKDYSVCIDIFRAMNPDFAGTVEQGIKSLLRDLERHKKNADNSERQVRTLENSQMSLEHYREEHKKQYEYYSKTIVEQSEKIRSIEKESGVEQARQEYYQAKKEHNDQKAKMLQEEIRLCGKWEELEKERDKARQEVVQMKKESASEKEEMEQDKQRWKKEKRELEKDLDDLQEKYNKLKRSQRDSD